jgi:hypothetical protein
LNTSTKLRLAGFVAAVGATALLVGAASGTTGAYFTDSHDGTVQGTSGHLKLNLSDASQLSMNFTDLVPGQDQTKHVVFTTDSSSTVTEDVWVVFPTTTPAQQLAYAQFSGAKGEFGYTDGGLGRYGHVQIGATTGSYNRAFVSYNLANDPALSDPISGGNLSACYDGNGRGGETQQATSPTDTSMGYCGVPKAILVASDLSSGASGSVDIAFGITGKWTGQNLPVLAGVNYKIVATQHGVLPTALNY